MQPKRKPTCHPDKVHMALGLCGACYSKRWRAENIGKDKESQAKWGSKNIDYLREQWRKQAKSYREKDIETARKRNRESYSRHREERIIYQKTKAYGITKEQYSKMLLDRNGKCDICQNIVAQLVVDHNHKTGAIRGMLCHTCNQAIGLFRENTLTIEKAIEYLNADKLDKIKAILE